MRSLVFICLWLGMLPLLRATADTAPNSTAAPAPAKPENPLSKERLGRYFEYEKLKQQKNKQNANKMAYFPPKLLSSLEQLCCKLHGQQRQQCSNTMSVSIERCATGNSYKEKEDKFEFSSSASGTYCGCDSDFDGYISFQKCCETLQCCGTLENPKLVHAEQTVDSKEKELLALQSYHKLVTAHVKKLSDWIVSAKELTERVKQRAENAKLTVNREKYLLQRIQRAEEQRVAEIRTNREYVRKESARLIDHRRVENLKKTTASIKNQLDKLSRERESLETKLRHTEEKIRNYTLSR